MKLNVVFCEDFPTSSSQTRLSGMTFYSLFKEPTQPFVKSWVATQSRIHAGRNFDLSVVQGKEVNRKLTNSPVVFFKEIITRFSLKPR
jgi:hypothetical protein